MAGAEADMIATFTSICDKRRICKAISIRHYEYSPAGRLTKIESYDISFVTLYNQSAYILTIEAITARPPIIKTPSSAHLLLGSSCRLQKAFNGRRKIVMSVRTFIAPSAK
jgi:hypothetical protein